MVFGTKYGMTLLVIAGWSAGGQAQTADSQPPIDRHALVTRHNIEVHELDPNGAMAVGNGDFAFNFDVTRAAKLSRVYEKTMPIGILSDWGWQVSTQRL